MSGPRLSDGIRLKSESGPIDRISEIERTGMTDACNWTNGDDRPRGVEIVCFYGLSTTKTRRFVNRKTRIYQGASRSDNVAYNMAIFSACLQQESVNFCVHFQKSRFFRKTQQESVDFYHHFLVGRSGRAGPFWRKPASTKNRKTPRDSYFYHYRKRHYKTFKVYTFRWDHGCY